MRLFLTFAGRVGEGTKFFGHFVSDIILEFLLEGDEQFFLDPLLLAFEFPLDFVDDSGEEFSHRVHEVCLLMLLHI